MSVKVGSAIVGASIVFVAIDLAIRKLTVAMRAGCQSERHATCSRIFGPILKRRVHLVLRIVFLLLKVSYVAA